MTPTTTLMKTFRSGITVSNQFFEDMRGERFATYVKERAANEARRRGKADFRLSEDRFHVEDAEIVGGDETPYREEVDAEWFRVFVLVRSRWD